MLKRRLSSFHLLIVMGWALLSSLLLGCSNYARNYVEPVLEDGAMRARKLLSVKDQRAFDRTYLAAMRQKYLGQADAAFDLLDAALMINPNDADALYQQGAILLENVYFSDSLLRLRGEQQIQLAQQLAPSNPYYRKQLADYWVERKLYERALRLYEQVVVDEPTEENFTLLELLQESTAHYDAALQTLDKLKELGGEVNGILARKTKVLELQNRISDGIALLREASEADAENSYSRVLLANLYLRNHYLDRAKEVIDDIATSEPHNEWVPLLRLVYYRNKNDVDNYDKTLAAVAADTVLAVNNKLDAFNEAAYWVGENNYNKEKVYEHAVTAMHQPGDGAEMAKWLLAFIEEHKLPEERFTEPARVLFREDPTNEDAAMTLLKDAVRNDDAEQADSICERGREFHPDNVFFYSCALYSRRARTNEDFRRKILREGVKNMSPYSDSVVASSLYGMLGDDYMELKQTKLAFAAYDSSLVRNPDNANTLNNYAYFLTIRGEQLERATEMAQRATEVDPNNINALDTYAWALYSTGHYAEAKTMIDSVFVLLERPEQEQQPSSDLYDHAGDVYLKVGLPREAKHFWKKAISLSTNHKEQRKLRGKLRKVR